MLAVDIPVWKEESAGREVLDYLCMSERDVRKRAGTGPFHASPHALCPIT